MKRDRLIRQVLGFHGSLKRVADCRATPVEAPCVPVAHSFRCPTGTVGCRRRRASDESPTSLVSRSPPATGTASGSGGRSPIRRAIEMGEVPATMDRTEDEDSILLEPVDQAVEAVTDFPDVPLRPLRDGLTNPAKTDVPTSPPAANRGPASVSQASEHAPVHACRVRGRSTPPPRISAGVRRPTFEACRWTPGLADESPP